MFYNETGIASWYGPKFHGKLTANGEIYNQNALTAAHKTLPLPSAVKVTNLENNKSLILRVNDRGPFVNDRIIDLSSKAADLLGLKKKGTGLVRVTILQDKSVALEKLAKKGSFPEINDLPKPETPDVIVPQKTEVKVEGISKDHSKQKNKKRLILPNTDTHKSFVKILKTFRAGSAIYAPIITSDKFIGQIICASQARNVMEEIDLSTLCAVSYTHLTLPTNREV